MHYAPWTFCILTFGCKVNQYESQSVREAWQRMAGTAKDTPAAADAHRPRKVALSLEILRLYGS